MRNLYLRTYSGHSCICPFFAVFWRTQANGFPRSLILRENLGFIWENQFTGGKSLSFRWFRWEQWWIKKERKHAHCTWFFIFANKSHFTCLCLKKHTFPSSGKTLKFRTISWVKFGLSPEIWSQPVWSLIIWIWLLKLCSQGRWSCVELWVSGLLWEFV